MKDSNNTVERSNQPTVVQSSQHSIIARAIWFIFFGWWATGIWLGIAWVLNITIIGIPLGLKMINKAPYIATLKKRGKYRLIAQSEGKLDITEQGPEQYSLWIQVLYFVLIGWWVSLAWIVVAYVFTILTVTLPLAFWMFDRLPFVTFLYRFEQYT